MGVIKQQSGIINISRSTLKTQVGTRLVIIGNAGMVRTDTMDPSMDPMEITTDTAAPCKAIIITTITATA